MAKENSKEEKHPIIRDAERFAEERAADMIRDMEWLLSDILSGDKPSEENKELLDTFLEAGYENFRKGDYEAALKCYEGCLNIPGIVSIGVRINKAEVLELLEKRDEAITNYRISLQECLIAYEEKTRRYDFDTEFIEATYAEALDLLTGLYITDGEYDLAEEAYVEFIEEGKKLGMFTDELEDQHAEFLIHRYRGNYKTASQLKVVSDYLQRQKEMDSILEELTKETKQSELSSGHGQLLQ